MIKLICVSIMGICTLALLISELKLNHNLNKPIGFSEEGKRFVCVNGQGCFVDKETAENLFKGE